MLDLSTTVWHGLVICVPFTVFAVGSFWLQPRLWLHSLPIDIAERAGPKTEEEVRRTRWLMIGVLIILPGLSIASLCYAAISSSVDLTVLGAFVHLYGVWLIVHLWDLIVIDLAHVLFINADSPPIPNTEGALGYRDFLFHCRAFAKACIFSLLFVGPAAVVMGTVF